jgi:hypothetical protein
MMVMLTVSSAHGPLEFNTQTDTPLVIAGSAMVPSGQIDATRFVGNRVNTNKARAGIARVIITANAGTVSVHAFGACSPTDCDWGTVTATPYAKTADGTKAVSLTTAYDFGYKDSLLTIARDGELLKVSHYEHFKDSSDRSNYSLTERFKKSR